MKMTLSFYSFCDNWPESRKDQFSYDAKKAIYDYIIDYEEAGNEETEFDPIAICCEWTEYDNALEAIKEYNGDNEEEADKELTEEEREAEALKYLQDNTTVLELDNGGVVIQQF